MKRCSTSPVIREMQIKITIRHHYTPIRLVIIQKKKKEKKETENSKCWQECEKLKSVYIVGENVNAVENSLEVPQKVNTGLPYDLAILLLGMYPQELKQRFE